MAKSVEEADVGISCYVSSLPGFRGILKQRYSDFIVNEVGIDGKVVHLESLIPQHKSEEEMEAAAVVEEEMKQPASDRDYTEQIELFRSLTCDSDVSLLTELLQNVASGKGNDISPIVLSPDPDKPHRAAVHNFFKTNLKFLETDTVDGSDGDSKCIRVRYYLGGREGRGQRGKKRKGTTDLRGKEAPYYDRRGFKNWPENLGKFLRFHLYKENKDTQEALRVVGMMLGTQPRSFGFAGTKDKRAITTQRVTVFMQNAKKLASLNSRLIGIKVGDFCYVDEGLVLGQLLGNCFTITLRGVVADSEEIIRTAADSLGQNGFINYYGLQRFGSGSVPTHLIGAELLRGNWEKAVGLILDPRDDERAFIREARQYYKNTGDIDGSLNQFPCHLVAERAILQCLRKLPGNYLQALKAIPRTLRMMYVHSYQSYLWNHVVSLRLQNHGVTQILLGDLVYSKEGSPGKLAERGNIDELIDSYDDDDSGVSAASETSHSEDAARSVKVITVEDLLRGCYTHEDVVLPLPGSKVQYPENNIADAYHDIAKKDGISLTESVHGAKEFSITSMSGGYRHILQRPVDLSWELLSYTDGNVPLVETDLDRMEKTRQTELIQNGSANASLGNGIQMPERKSKLENNDINENGSCLMSSTESSSSSTSQASQTALKLRFTLPASCYATMAIRELLKTSTSVAYHKAMN